MELLKRVYPLEDLKSNPLLLSNRSVFALLTTVQEGYRDSSGHRVTGKSSSRTSSPSPPVPSLMMTTTMPPRSKLAVGLELADRKLIRQPLVKLRGKKELLKDAQSAGEGMNEHLRELRFQAQYTDHPFNNTWKGVSVPSPDGIPVATLQQKSSSSTMKSNSRRGGNSSNTIPPLSRSVSGTFTRDHPVQMGNSNPPPLLHITHQSPPPMFDDDVMVDLLLPSHRERVTRSLQVLGQCPIPENYVSLNINTIAALVDHTSSDSIDPTYTYTNTGAVVGANTTSRIRDAAVTPSLAAFRTITSGDQLQPPQKGPSSLSLSSSSLSPKPTTMVETFYSYRGAQLSLLQQRRPVAHRVDDIFCRTDEGEWHGLQKGRAMRAFEFKDHLFTSGKLKEQQRKDMQALLRAAYSVDVIECDVPTIRSLIQQAQLMRGSVLALDILQCEVFIRKYRTACKYALRGQSWFRGNR